MSESKLPYYCLQMSESHALRGNSNFFTCVQNILCNSGFGYVWLSKSVGNERSFILQLKLRLKDIETQNWRAFLETCTIAYYYKHIKMSISAEPYLDGIKIER